MLIISVLSYLRVSLVTMIARLYPMKISIRRNMNRIILCIHILTIGVPCYMYMYDRRLPEWDVKLTVKFLRMFGTVMLCVILYSLCSIYMRNGTI